MLLFVILQVAPQPWAANIALQRAGRYLADGNPGAAAVQLAEAARHLPWRPELWEQAGIYAWQAGEAEAARVYLENAAERQALSAEGWLVFGKAQLFAGDFQAALDAWTRAEVAGFSPEVIAESRLEAHLAQADYPAAINDLQILVEDQPVDAQRRYRLGLLLASQQPEAALVHLTQAGDLDPELAVPARQMVNRLRTALLAGDPAYLYLESGRALAALGEWTLAAEAFRQSLVQRPDYAEAWAYLGEAKQHLPRDFGESRLAYQALEQALQLDPESIAAHTFMALYWQRQGDDQQAYQHLEIATGLDPNNPALLTELGRVLARMGKLDSAAQVYWKAVELDESDVDYWRQWVEFSLTYDYQVGTSALPSARQAVLLAPQDPAALDILGQVLLRLGDLDNAARFFIQALQIRADYLPAHVHLGLAAVLRGADGQARQTWEWVVNQAPGTPAAAQASRLLQNYFR